MRTDLRRIDFHHHALPASLVDAYEKAGMTVGTWSGGWPDWSPALSLGRMDEQGTDAALLSISSPGVHFGDDRRARELTADLNEQLAETSRDRPDRFGFLAALPLPDVDGALAEATHALDDLGADGVGVLANSRGQYLFDPELEPLLAELDRRAALLVVHPNVLPGGGLKEVPAPLADFPLDTTRAAFGLVRTGALRRYPDLRIVLAHAGGLVPFLVDRFVQTLAVLEGDLETDRIRADVGRFWFDTALSTGPTQLPSITEFVGSDRLVYGSDTPFAPPSTSNWYADRLDSGLPAEDLRRITRGTALELVPRFGGSQWPR